MREIKFRAWNKRDKLMEYLDYLNLSKAQFCGNWNVAPPEDLFDVATVKGSLLLFSDVTLMQYTGMRDKKNVEIFEGDIVKIPHYHDKRTYINGFVKFKDGSFLVDYVDMEGIISCHKDNIEVIGNIYENPELLKKDDDE